MLFVVAALCAACRDEPTRQGHPEPSRAAHSTPRDGGTLFRRLDADVSTLNPIVATTGYDRLVATYLFTPLLQYDKNLRPIGGVAESWQISSDGRRYRFRLNDRATFSDGTAVRASDVVFTLRKVADPASGSIQTSSSFELLDLSQTRAVADRTVEVAFKEPLATQLTSFTDLFVLPEHVYGKGDFRSDFSDRAVGSGPYRLVRREVGKTITLERRADYWSARPHIQTVVFKVISDHNTAWNALQRGEIDETLITSDRWNRVHADAALNKTIEFHRFYGSNYNAVAWNNRHELLADRDIRRALALCIPVDALVRDIAHGSARGISGPFTPDEWASNPSVETLPYDPQQARMIFRNHGWADRDGDGLLDKKGKPFSLEFIVMAGNAPTQQLAQTLQAEWKKIGLDIRLVLFDGATAIQRLVAGDYEAAYVGWSLDPDPDPYALFHSAAVPPRGQNVVFYSSREADDLIEAARRELDRAKRQRLYWRFHEIVAADQPYAWVMQSAAKWGINRRVRGVETSRSTGFFSWYPGELGWWLADER